jgi:hypothetical protein
MENVEGKDYFLGNVRQLVSDTAPDAKVTLTREYSPYGEIVSQLGAGKTEYGFTGELQDGGLVHLRARDYAFFVLHTFCIPTPNHEESPLKKSLFITKNHQNRWFFLYLLVGARGFEPPTSCTPFVQMFYIGIFNLSIPYI